MKLHIISDLHTEGCKFDIPQVESDVLILAGDIVNGNNPIHQMNLLLEKETRPVIHVAGNHEFYNSSVPHTLEKLSQTSAHFLEKQSIVIDEVRFLGCTLWTGFKFNSQRTSIEDQHRAAACIRDFIAIQVDHTKARKISPGAVVNWYSESIRWLESELKKPFDGKTVVVTHFGPASPSAHPKYMGTPQDKSLTAYFINRLDDWFEGKPIDLWIHGHTHESCDYELHGIRVICNPRGYVRRDSGLENDNFNPELVIEI